MKNRLLVAGTAFAGLIHRHPKRVSAMVAAFLLCGGGGAFAVATFGPDPSNLPTRQVLLAVQPLAAPPAEQAAVLDQHHFRLYSSGTTRASDTADGLLQRLGVSDDAAAAFIRGDAVARRGLLGGADRSVSVQTDDQHELLQLTARWITDDSGNFQRLVIEKTPQGFSARVETAPLTAQTHLGSGIISSTLLGAVDAAHIPTDVTAQLVDIFSDDIDLHSGLRKGDRFSVVYQTLEADGEPIASDLVTGRVLSAEIVNKGQHFQAMWFQNPTAADKGAYYTLDGKSLHPDYLSSPVTHVHITSGYQMRYDPIQHSWKMHEGIDFAGPIGTPVHAVADGVVTFAGVQTGYGKVVNIMHPPGADGSHMTVYAHLSKITVRQSEKVGEGETIGLLGESGWATGPHVHFEYRVNGVPENPVLIARQNNTLRLTAAVRPAFDRLASSMRMQLADAALVQQASAQ